MTIQPDEELPIATSGSEPPVLIELETPPGPTALGEPAELVQPTEPEATPDEPEPAPTPDEPEPAPTPEPARRTAGRAAAELLAAAGIRIAFTVPGESFLGLLEELPRVGIRVVAARHESGAGFMAEASAQLTGRPALCLVTRAVGAANLGIALHAARQDSAPVIAIVGQVSRPFLGREAFQEADLVTTIGGLCAWATEIRDPAALPGAVVEAVRRSTAGRPGPVLLSVPEDVWDEEVVGELPPILPLRRGPDPDHAIVRRVLHLVAGAARPLILAGGGVLRSGATRELVTLAEMLEIPVAAAWRRPDVFPNDHPLYLGMAGYGSPPSVQERLVAADALIVIGSRLNEPTTFGYQVPRPGVSWAHVDLVPRAGAAGLGTPDLAIAADAGGFLRAARRVLAGAAVDAASLIARRSSNAADRSRFVAERRVDDDAWEGPGVHPGRVVATLGRLLAPDAIITTDAGNFGGWPARGLVFGRPGTFVGSTSGAMGFGLPAAIGAALARPGRRAVALAGDGGFAMSMGEIETAVRERARVTALVFDNRRYGTIRAHQETRGRGQGIGTELGPVDFAAIARAMGAHGIHVATDDEVEPALREALAVHGPSIVHLDLDPRWLAVGRSLDA